jgi:hypothetical protein
MTQGSNLTQRQKGTKAQMIGRKQWSAASLARPMRSAPLEGSRFGARPHHLAKSGLLRDMAAERVSGRLPGTARRFAILQVAPQQFPEPPRWVIRGSRLFNPFLGNTTGWGLNSRVRVVERQSGSPPGCRPHRPRKRGNAPRSRA